MPYFPDSGRSEPNRPAPYFSNSQNLYSSSMSAQNNRNDAVLHGVTLAIILDYLVDEYGFEELGK